MPWTYSQSTGQLSHNGAAVAQGYSGSGTGRNNPDAEMQANVGPIPRGRYHIGLPHQGEHTGPHTMNLAPVRHNANGRTNFRIHGDNSTHTASTGCIILPPQIRHQISGSGDNVIDVVR